MPVTTEQKDEILGLIRAGNKVEAIKRFRKITGVGLTEALQAITMIEERSGIAGGGASGGSASTSIRAVAAAVKAIDPKQIRRAEEAALAALRDNNVMEAIKRYRQHTGLGLKESKEAVDALGVVHRSEGRIKLKLAQSLIGLIASGKKEEALTLVMSNTGYEDAEARKLIRNIGNMRANPASCAGGCLRFILALAAIGGILWYALNQAGLF